MSEENLNNQENTIPAQEAPVAEAQTAPAEPVEVPVAESAAEPAMTQPQVIVQKERGFSHYVGFALLCVLCILFFFAPGIALTYAIDMIPGVSLGATAAWVFSAILSLIVWFIFKLKIKGFKKSFYVYMAICVLVIAILVAAEILTEQTGVFANILAMLTGANA